MECFLEGLYSSIVEEKASVCTAHSRFCCLNELLSSSAPFFLVPQSIKAIPEAFVRGSY